MNRTNALLTAITVLLAINVVARFVEPQQAQAQTMGVVEPDKTVVGGAVIGDFLGQLLFRFWSDGSVDATVVSSGLGCAVPIIQCSTPVLPSVCAAADFDLSGTVDFEDLLAVLTQWGGCEPPPKS